MYRSRIPVDHRRLFLEHLSTIDRVVHEVARRHHLRKDVAEDFASLVRVRLMEDDCQVLRAFRGQSSMSTFLKTVVTRLLLDFRSEQWGRWRPSERARALGDDAVGLERLLYRDGYRLDEAIQILRVARRGLLSDAEVERLWTQLPARPPRGPSTDQTPLDQIPDPRQPSDPVSESEDAQAVAEALRRSFESLTPADRMLIRLHFGRGIPLVQIARMWQLSRATIMRRLARVLATLRTALEGTGVGGFRVRELIRSGVLNLALLQSDETVVENCRLSLDDAQER